MVSARPDGMRRNGANGMNTSRWEGGGWTALVGGNPTERIGRSRVNDIEGKTAREAASACGKRPSVQSLKAIHDDVAAFIHSTDHLGK
jgi:hypothetical protein